MIVVTASVLNSGYLAERERQEDVVQLRGGHMNRFTGKMAAVLGAAGKEEGSQRTALGRLISNWWWWPGFLWTL